MTPIDQHSDLPPVELITAKNDYAAQNIVIANVGDYALITRDTDDDRLLTLWLAQHPNPTPNANTNAKPNRSALG